MSDADLPEVGGAAAPGVAGEGASEPPTGIVAQSLRRLGIGRKALGDGASGLAVEGAQLVGTLVFFALLSRRLGPADYGSFSAMYGLIGISIALAHIGPGLALLQHAMGNDMKKVSAHFFSIYLACVAGAVVIVMVLAPFLLPRVSTLTVMLFMVAELFGAALVQLSSTMRLIVTGFHSTVPLQVIPVIVKVIAVVCLFVADALTLRTYGIVYAMACVVIGVTVFLKVTSRLEVPRRPRRMRKDYVTTTLTLSSTIWVFNLHNDGDKLTMSANDLRADVGLYSAAYRLVMLAVIPINALVTSSYRTFVDPAVGHHFRRAAKYTLATTIYCAVAALALIIVAPIALPLVAGDKYDGAVSITRWLAPLMIVRGFTHFPLNAIMGLGHPKVRLVCIAISATVAMTIYITLIPTMSWKGAVIGSYVSDTVLAILAWVMLWRVRNDWRLTTEEPQPFEITSAG